MDGESFDGLTKRLNEMTTRRAALRAASASGIVAITAHLALPADARRRRKRKKKCTKCEGRCLRPGDVCCPPDKGGGLCEAALPVCCGPSPLYPDGRCLPAGQICCGDVNCFATQQKCCPPSPAAPQGTCVSPDAPCP